MFSSSDGKILDENEIKEFFSAKEFSSRKTLFVVGVGFDSRMCAGIKLINETGIVFDVWKISYDEGFHSPSRDYIERVKTNESALDSIIDGKKVIRDSIVFWKKDEDPFDSNQRFVGEIEICKLIKKREENIKEYTDVIIDISAFPQTIFLCLLNSILKLEINASVYIIVDENYKTDLSIRPVQSDESAHELYGFTSPSDDLKSVVVWYPILGEGNMEYLAKYSDYLNSGSGRIDEICPVVPFPAKNIRRADDVLQFYSKKVFDEWRIDKKNIMYSSEYNPFSLCNDLVNASKGYKDALSVIGECKFVFSAITSKVMTVGVLFAANRLKQEGSTVSLLGISNKGYTIDGNMVEDDDNNRLLCIIRQKEECERKQKLLVQD